jgi:hypothetical protein
MVGMPVTNTVTFFYLLHSLLINVALFYFLAFNYHVMIQQRQRQLREGNEQRKQAQTMANPSFGPLLSHHTGSCPHAQTINGL